MKTLVVYFSNHHLNTLKLVEFLDGEVGFDKLELRENRDVSELELDIDQYDRVIFASGVYYGKLAKEIYDFARLYKDSLANKDVATIATAGLESVDYIKEFEEEISELGIKLKGKFQCRGYCTYGPLKLIGGFSINHPDKEDFDKLLEFYRNL